MKPKAKLLFLFTLLFSWLLFSTVEAREMECFGKGGLQCYCCFGKWAADSSETFSPCSCPGSDQSLPLFQDILGIPAPPDLKLPIQRVALGPASLWRNFFGLIPQKPPPHLF